MFDKEEFDKYLEQYKNGFVKWFEQERFKWEAIKQFETYWDINADDFSEMYAKATEKTSVLLASMNNYPRKTMQDFAEKDPETVRAMFINLFDENKEVSDRVIKFQSAAQELCDRLSPGKQSFQRPTAISVYLWLHNPDKYSIYKYTSFRLASRLLKNDYIPAKGDTARNYRKCLEFTKNIRDLLVKDGDIIQMFDAAKDDKCYSDSTYLTLADDFKLYVSRKPVASDDGNVWFALDYDTGITKEVWKELLLDPEVFNKKGLEIVTRMLDYGGEATCIQLALKYGGRAASYNLGSTELAKRVAKKTGCELMTYENGVNYWPVLYIGRNAKKDEDGAFLWKLRPELKEALEETDLSGVKLYEDTDEDAEEDAVEESSICAEQPVELEKYTEEDFLNDVYMTQGNYETLRALLLKKQNVILKGAPGVGKTFAAKRLAYSIMGVKDEERIEFIQFHQSYSYEDFIMGYKPDGEGFSLEEGIFYKFCKKAGADPGRAYFFIIDEINRGNMSKIFGELLMLIEKDYRGETTTMAYDGRKFTVPENLYIIGMMNTADRSLALIDYALRRRFSFFSMEPGFGSDGFRKYQAGFNDETFDTLIKRIEELNTDISKDSSLGPGFCIGHSYFCGQKEISDEWMQSVVEYDILPMLEEYWFDDSSKLQIWQNALRGVFSDL